MKKEILTLIERFPQCKGNAEEIQNAFFMLRDCYENGGKVLIAGNGGSACDAEHIVGELMKGFLKDRKLPEAEREKINRVGKSYGNTLAKHLQGALPAISLSSHTGFLTAIGNDTDYGIAYAQGVYGYGKEGDIFWGISTSGNSVNVIKAAIVAKVIGMKVLGMTGESGGALKELCDVCICVPSRITSEIQEMHMPVYHVLCTLLEGHFFK